MKKLISLVLLLVIILGFLVVNPNKVSAFNANNLMDDGIFENSSSMNAAQIDAWINQFPSSCIRSQSGFTTPDPQGWSGTQYVFGGNVTVGQAIYDTSQLYHVNPQVILSTMQKEQSLVTGSAGCYAEPNPNTATPMTNQCGSGTRNCTLACTHSGGCMNIAMGYGCPNYCDAKDEGFSMQITLGTWLLRFGQQRAYGNLTGYVGYEQGDENFTYSGPMTAGNRKRSASSALITYDGTYTTQDGVSVNIANGTTASLYNFTPFTSGNSNFDSIFQNWFGSLYVPSYSWQMTGQNAYTDQTKTTAKNMSSLLVGDKVYVTFSAKNTGNVTWANSGPNAVMVGTVGPQERQSTFSSGSGWLSSTRPALLKESSVAPGATGHFEFWMTANSNGVFNERFGLVANGIAWFNDTGLSYYANVAPATYSWQMMSQYADKDMSNLKAGDKVKVGFTAKNTGNTSWSNSGSNPIRVGTLAPIERSSIFAPGSNWLGSSRPAALKESSVAPGGIGTFEFTMTVPNSPGVYNERFGLVVEGRAWLNDVGLSYYARILSSTYSWQIMSQYAYTNSTKLTAYNMANMHPGNQAYIGFTAKNTGNVTWTNSGSNAVMVGTVSPQERQSLFFPGSGWLSSTRPALLKESSVAPGATGTFEFYMTAPNTLGVYNERFGLIANGIAWFNDPGLSYYAKVQ